MSNNDGSGDKIDQVDPGNSPDPCIEYYEDIDEDNDEDETDPDEDDIDWDDD